MKINIAGVAGFEGARLEFNKVFDAGDFEFAGSEYSFEPIAVTGEIANIGSALKIFMRLEGKYKTLCDRCGRDIEKDFAAEIEDNLTGENESADEEMFVLNGHILDISGAVNALLYSNLPMVNLCKEDCKGICPKCGVNKNESECNCDTTRYDPRFAIFRKLSENGEV